ncbi:hypothetical protein FHS29_005668 [Saccharothrix tamanrassetensis]|uniref:Uncharacterized protein n=1 Tax=Saccharothrix tamanrassetensis TaxID=1051531 RepID=A0A841CSC0_9PSEU|nr:hypothetical protein [Saccharothrix tamanrassetensis]MBB5959048.1 hypothetical protein [Saccharothrix tamanrassetensis]
MSTEYAGHSAVTELATAISVADRPVVDHWGHVAGRFHDWAGRPGLQEGLRAYLGALTPQEEMRVIARSRETTTHFAWCLRDEPAEPFTFWLHEYKPQRDWRRGYADSIHNHRYHFCTILLTGSYLHERFTVRLAEDGRSIRDTTLLRSTQAHRGDSGTMLAHEFHRIPKATDDTLTFLVKSRAVNPWSLSFDPDTRTSHRHVPVESRLEELARTLQRSGT